MQKPPVGFRGDTGIGALTGLSGVGQQDPFLYDFDSKREYNYREYSQATPYYKFYRPAESTFLGEDIRYTFRPQTMGDLLTGLMLKFTFPSTTGTPTCLKNIGLSMIKRIDLIVNGSVLQSLRGDWMSIYESMYSNEQDRQNIFNVSFNLGATYDTQPTLKANDTSQRLFFPLPFFFNNHYTDSRVDTTSFRAPMPLCAMYNSEVTIYIQFRALADIVSDTDGFAAGADLTDFMFVTEEVTLTQSERLMLRSTRQEYPIEKITAEESEVPAVLDQKFRYYFNSAYSCRAIFWNLKENKLGYNPRFYDSIVNARISTNQGTDRNEIRLPLFLQQLQAYIHDYHNDGSFYGYSFSEKPLQVVLGDYEFRAPRPQSAYIDIELTIASGLYQNWSQTLTAIGVENFTIEGQKILLDTSVGLSVDKLKSLDMKTNGFFRTSTAGVGIPGTAYSSVINNILPYYMRFEPWSNVYKITISSVEYFPSTTSHYVDSSGNYQDGSFTYSGGTETVNVPFWIDSSNTNAVVIVQDGADGAPLWGTCTANLYATTVGTPVAVSTIASSFTQGTNYPTDSGTTATNPHLKITPDSRTNINTFVPVVENYILTMYYLSTNKFIVDKSTVDVIDFDERTGIIDDRIEIERKAAEARAEALKILEEQRELERLEEEKRKRIEMELIAIKKAAEEKARLEAEEAARLAEEQMRIQRAAEEKARLEAEEAARLAEEERRRIAEEQMRIQRAAEEKARLEAEEERKRRARKELKRSVELRAAEDNKRAQIEYEKERKRLKELDESRKSR